MQSPFEGKQPIGVVYNTAMDRPDAALALALLYGFQGKRDSRIGSVSINESGLDAAIFCDLVQRFYSPGPLRNGNQVLMPGLAADGPLPVDSVMVKAVVERKNEQGEPQYVRSIRRVGDTSLPEAVIRNGVIFNADAVMILSAKATYLAKTLDLAGVPELYKERVKRLVIVDSGAPQDVPAMRRVLAEFPAPIVFCAREIGEALPFPGASIDKDFSWAPAHPIADAYHAFRSGVYDFPSYDLAAALYAVHPDKNFFGVTEGGDIRIGSDGSMQFAGGEGKMRSLAFDPAKKQEILDVFVAVSSAKPVVPTPRVRKPAVDAVATPAAKKPSQ
jgi:hypothetical protein